jgi:hypothetical protein
MNINTQQVQQYTLQEGINSPNLWVPGDQPIAFDQFNLSGTIVVSAVTGAPAAQTTLWPVLNNLMGKLTWQGKPKDKSGGMLVKQIPFGFFWWLDWLYNSNQPPNTGTVTPLTATTYTVNFTVTVPRFDPKWSDLAQRMACYRGARYGKPYWQFLHGFFCPAAGVTDPDTSAYVGTATYTTALTVTYSVGYVTDLGQTPNDECFDMAVEYPNVFSFGNSSSQGNNINLTEREIQNLILLFNTSVGSTGIETPINNLGVTGGQLIKTKFGAKPKDEFNPQSLQGRDQQIWLANQVWPTGAYAIDQINRTLSGVNAKTLLATSGEFYIDTNPGTVPGGATSQSLRPLHLSHNLSATAMASLNPTLKPFGGMS